MDFRLSSISIRARDVKKLASFYKDTFELAVHRSGAHCVILTLGPELYLVIEKLGSFPEAPKAAPEKTPGAGGPSRYGMAFEVDDLEAAVRKLKVKLGITSAPTREDWGALTVSGRDPEGNRIDLFQRLKTAAAR